MADASPTRQMSLTAFLMPAGQHSAAWRDPRSASDAGVDFAHYKAMAQIAEAGKLDALFLADFAGSIGSGEVEAASRSSHDVSFEPITLLSALAAVTEKIGLVATVSSTFNTPYDLARKFASLDLISGGRSGWNLVTSVNESEAYNYGLEEHVRHADRYARAAEFVDVAKGLWSSWEEGAFVRDREAGRFFDPSKMHVLNHEGRHFKVRGPLNVGRSPQGAPVIFQAGSSEAGRELAAQSGEAIFTAHQTLLSAREFYTDVKSRLGRYRRTAEQMKIMPGAFPVVAETQSEAEDIFERLQNLVHPESGLLLLSQLVGFDLSGYSPEDPLPDMPETNGNKSRQKLIVDLAREKNLNLRQIYQHIAGARGHWTIVGSTKQVADALEDWFVGGGADGFNLMPPVLPDSLERIVHLLVPELQRRGLFRTNYSGRTLRSHLGLA
ncbi:LLM class flavin-dependent oxidoreductase [Rhizobium sp. BG4]|uniref:LLM class flavin-dependent oxidoreductase n=1 Tax=Rhizobium sp. BG4 TaxID=2613770 RepID=UPI001029CA99|nr:LLM class flavin-dependent oxidoreductase [Rhizobium sp. BG4]QRM46099.1 LLM class flavin-dependent oxidoreductase [Rhizobium sp. BG4]